MGKFTIEKWRCDRCGAVADKWLRPAAAYTVRIDVHYDTAGGSIIDWKEMCRECCGEVEGALSELKAIKHTAASPSKEPKQ